MYYVDAKHLSFPHKHYFPIFVCVKVNYLYIFCTPFRWWPRYIKAPLVFLLPNQKCFHLDPREREKCSTLYIRLNKNFWNALPCISRASLPYPIWQLVTGLYKSLTSSVSRQYAKQKMVKLRAIYRVSRSADHFSKHMYVWYFYDLGVQRIEWRFRETNLVSSTVSTENQKKRFSSFTKLSSIMYLLYSIFMSLFYRI